MRDRAPRSFDERQHRPDEHQHGVVSRLELLRRFAEHLHPLGRIADLRVGKHLVEESVGAAGGGDRLVDRIDPLRLRKLRRFGEEVADHGTVSGGVHHALRAIGALPDPLDVALLIAHRPLRISLRPLLRDAKDLTRLRQHHRTAVAELPRSR